MLGFRHAHFHGGSCPPTGPRPAGYPRSERFLYVSFRVQYPWASYAFRGQVLPDDLNLESIKPCLILACCTAL